MFKSFFDSLKTSFSERASNPFVGSFIFAWIAFNWRFLAVLFLGDSKVDERLEFIDNAQLAGGSNPGLHLWPLTIAVLYALGMPYVNGGIEWVRQFGQQWRKSMKLDNALRAEQQREELVKKRAEVSAYEARFDDQKLQLESRERRVIDLESAVQANETRLARFQGLHEKHHELMEVLKLSKVKDEICGGLIRIANTAEGYKINFSGAECIGAQRRQRELEAMVRSCSEAEERGNEQLAQLKHDFPFNLIATDFDRVGQALDDYEYIRKELLDLQNQDTAVNDVELKSQIKQISKRAGSIADRIEKAIQGISDAAQIDDLSRFEFEADSLTFGDSATLIEILAGAPN